MTKGNLVKYQGWVEGRGACWMSGVGIILHNLAQQDSLLKLDDSISQEWSQGRGHLEKRAQRRLSEVLSRGKHLSGIKEIWRFEEPWERKEGWKIKAREGDLLNRGSLMDTQRIHQQACPVRNERESIWKRIRKPWSRAENIWFRVRSLIYIFPVVCVDSAG